MLIRIRVFGKLMKKQTTMLASIAAVTIVAAMLTFSGVLNFAAAKTTSEFSNDRGIGSNIGAVQKIIVDIDSPYGQETISSFKLFQTDNLMKKSGFYTLRLFGPIMRDKLTLLGWIEQDLGKLPEGLYIETPITTGGNKPAKMTKMNPDKPITMVPMKGKVTLQLLEGNQDLLPTVVIRQFEFSGCHVAGYTLGTNYDDEKQYFHDGLQHFEEVDFACTDVKDMSTSSSNNRGLVVLTAINNDDRKITNEKGELIITNREYRQPIVMEGSKNIEGSKYVKQDLVTRTALDKTNYKIGDVATFTITFTDTEGNNIDPDTIRAVYDSKLIQLEKKDVGIYTFTTPGLTKEAHQIIVSAEKTGFPTDTSYLSIPISRIS